SFPRDRPLFRRGVAAQVPGFRERMAERNLSLVPRLPAPRMQAGHLGASARVAERLDETLSRARDAANRVVDSRVVAGPSPPLAAGARDVVPSLPPPARPAQPGRLDLL